MSLRWIPFLARRYLWKKKNKGITSAGLSILGIAVGVITLNVVLGVMNGFQMGFMETLLEVSSSHIRIEMPSNRELTADVQHKILQDTSIRNLIPYYDSQTLINGFYGTPRGAFIRGLPEKAIFEDPEFGRHLEMIEGSWDLERGEKIVLGAELARSLGARVGDRVSLLALGGENFSLLRPKEVFFQVTGVFRSGFYDIDLGWGFMNIENASDFFGAEAQRIFGIKLKNHFDDLKSLPLISSIVVPLGGKVESWREFNKAFFGALRLEKLTMMVLIALIFPVVWLNIQHSLRRTIRERREDIGIMKALGASIQPIRIVFLSEGAFIGFIGGVIGTLVGLLITVNMNSILFWMEDAVSFVLQIWTKWTTGSMGNRLNIISGGVFYLKDIPVRVLAHEVWIIFLFALGSASASAWMASGEILKIRTKEVLRNE